MKKILFSLTVVGISSLQPALSAGGGAGMIPVTLTITVEGITSAPSADQFTVVVFPTVTDVIFSTGPIGSTVAIDGTSFSTAPGGHDHHLQRPGREFD